MRIAAFDLSLARTGYAMPESVGVIVPPKGRDRGMLRMQFIRERIVELTYQTIDLIVLEGYAFGAKGQGIYERAELGGIVRYTLFSYELPYVEIAPTALKKYATGKGNAPKDVVFAAAIRKLGYQGSDNNEADALWLRTMALDHYGAAPVVMPQVNRDALAGVQWPARIGA